MNTTSYFILGYITILIMLGGYIVSLILRATRTKKDGHK